MTIQQPESKPKSNHESLKPKPLESLEKLAADNLSAAKVEELDTSASVQQAKELAGQVDEGEETAKQLQTELQKAGQELEQTEKDLQKQKKVILTEENEDKTIPAEEKKNKKKKRGEDIADRKEPEEIKRKKKPKIKEIKTTEKEPGETAEKNTADAKEELSEEWEGYENEDMMPAESDSPTLRTSTSTAQKQQAGKKTDSDKTKKKTDPHQSTGSDKSREIIALAGNLGKEDIDKLLDEVRPLLLNPTTRPKTVKQITEIANRVAYPQTMTSSIKGQISMTGQFGGARLTGYQARNFRLLAEEIESTGTASRQANSKEIKLLYESAANLTLRALMHCERKPPLPQYSDIRLYIQEQVKPLFTNRRKYGLSVPLLKEIEAQLIRITKKTTTNKKSVQLYLGSTAQTLNELWN